jgi:hypothetical protein
MRNLRRKQPMKLLLGILLIALLAFVAWPYVDLFRLDRALGAARPLVALAPLVDLDAVRAGYKRRFDRNLDHLIPLDPAHPVRNWLEEPLQRFGAETIEQAVDLTWVWERLREAVRRHSDQASPYLLSAVDYAFFESWDQFLVRLGRIGEGESYLRLRLEGNVWRLVDLID